MAEAAGFEIHCKNIEIGILDNNVNCCNISPNYSKLYSDIEKSLQNDRTSHEQIQKSRHNHTNKLNIVAKCGAITQKT